MENLATVAVVTQQVAPRLTQETAADFERARLDLERSRMWAEDEAAQLHRRHKRQVVRHRGLLLEMEGIREDAKTARDDAVTAREWAEIDRDDAVEERLEAVKERVNAVYECGALREHLEESTKIIGKLQHASNRLRDEQSRARQAERFAHAAPEDTEVEAQRKFLKRCR